jgi:hypothetical protein
VSGTSWPAILAGAVAAVATTLILVASGWLPYHPGPRVAPRPPPSR